MRLVIARSFPAWRHVALDDCGSTPVVEDPPVSGIASMKPMLGIFKPQTGGGNGGSLRGAAGMPCGRTPRRRPRESGEAVVGEGGRWVAARWATPAVSMISAVRACWALLDPTRIGCHPD